MNQQSLPGASEALTYGILSIVLTLFCCGPFGAVFSFLGISNANKAHKLYLQNTGEYAGYENSKTGKILSYVGLAIAAIYLLFFLLYFGVIIAFIVAVAAEGNY
ncbi:hypothetical protein I2486_12765 [Cellulophaga sp. E16_2]|uniref:Interferon-induced transmembrane protein n=1 Tax=Cellulophaga algicola (strain DSM 14237 / IC166 / ACAM 630) TaxID=688270 RepID=E6XAH5_CELAD|nr:MULTISPECIES: CCC motif membrane protein [Cellulophaga]ADV49891.1 hypothetical protein Celal_2606 [Cellulophaga algicola DSM 14237]MBO0592273.1 hypothetical protein [Cellulophaga sp. E16_2]